MPKPATGRPNSDLQETQRFHRDYRHQVGNRIVTAIEILSPANKETEAGRATYPPEAAPPRRRRRQSRRNRPLAKRRLHDVRAARQGAGGIHEALPNLRDTCRASGSGEVYRVSLREQLPKFRIPLRETDKDALLDLQAIIDLAYENGVYDDTNYHRDPAPPLSQEDADWADTLWREGAAVTTRN